MVSKYFADEIKYCHGKVPYDKRGAITAANKRWQQDHIKLRIYQCGDHWHLTKQVHAQGWKNFKRGKTKRKFRSKMY